MIAVQPRSEPRRRWYGTVADDELTPVANGERPAHFISDARLVILSGARHGYYLERGNATGAVLEFLAAHSLTH